MAGGVVGCGRWQCRRVGTPPTSTPGARATRAAELAAPSTIAHPAPATSLTAPLSDAAADAAGAAAIAPATTSP